jgi:predicted ribonuclease YlaK
VLVWTDYRIPASPTWWQDVQPILNEYAQLYPVMKRFVMLAVVAVYIVGLFVGNLIGRTVWKIGEVLAMKIPLIRAIYPAVKQVTEFVLHGGKSQFKASTVVAVQPHEKGIWSIGLQPTGEKDPFALRRHALVFGTGPAGTGKTWLAVAHAVSLFERKEVDRIILSRPAVEAGERLGFLPGDLREKVDPYLRPIYDALYDLMDSRIVERALQAGEIEIAPLAFMRGRTLTNAVIILDEAQNTTSMQMKMFLTRLGENSRMIITGDPSQVDLPNGQTSGLAEAVRLLDGVEGISQVKFTAEDVIRHELVARIVAAYEGLPQKPATGRS